MSKNVKLIFRITIIQTVMINKDIYWVIIKEFQGNINPQEKNKLEEWRNQSAENEKIYSTTRKVLDKTPELRFYSQIDLKKNWKQIDKRTKSKLSLQQKILKYRSVAALILLSIIISSIFLIVNDGKKVEYAFEQGIKPGESKAILELPDGRVIELNALAEENFEEIEGTTISDDKSFIIYNPKLNKNEIQSSLHKLNIPRGGEYKLQLSDGTKVWLNSETLLKYPSHFTGEKRVVYIEGEAYFEVAEDKTRPFKIISPRMHVEVLGTSFNFKAYPEQSQSTITLVNGKVNVLNTGTNKSYSLTPNEQVSCSAKETNSKEVDIEQYTAWKNGRILFEESTLDEILTELSRWYNVNIQYQNTEIKSLRFTIDIEKYKNFETILEILELTQKVSFKIKDNTVTIMKPKP